ncbi:MAG: vanadium-dependent haloperoxidase [Verrucomicrobiota bacterium]|nr:vanadium-dependent haloperoxidase [Verrucomicrobiota bacterium]
MKTPATPFRFILCTFLLVGLAGAVARASAGVILDWNIAMTSYSESLPPPGMPPFVESRVYAMAHIAMLNAITGDDAAAKPFSKIAAAAQAAHDVLVNQLPGGAANFDALLATELAAIADGPRKDRGGQLGATAAARKLAFRANDGSATAEGPYTPGDKPGDYQFTPPFDGPPFNGYAAVPKWGQVTPFVMKNGRQFRAAPPYTVRNLEYTFDYNEIKALGSQTSVGRTADQTDLALFWYENSSFSWNRIARLLVAQKPMSMLEHARLFATLNAALADAYIASLDSNYVYNFWRPITAIQRGGDDGNRLTTPDLGWQPLLLTPPVPEYPSAHATAGGAASRVLIFFFEGDKRTFTFSSTFPVPPRTFFRISDAAKENAISRMFVGIHFRLACTVGYHQGVEVGNWVVQQVAEHAVGWEN